MSENLDALKASNGLRLQSLGQRGAVVNGLREHYIQELLEYIVGSELEIVQQKHELWVADQLDNLESQYAKLRLLGGLPQPQSPKLS